MRPFGHNPLEFPATANTDVADEFGNVIISVETDGDITGDALTQRMEYGIWNGAYPIGPALGSNVNIDNGNDQKRLPYFTGPTDVSGGSITWQWGTYSAFPSGQAIFVAIAPGGASDESQIEQIIPVGGDFQGDFADRIRLACVSDAASTGTFTVALKLQYLDASDNTIGSEVSTSGTIAPGATLKLALDATTTGIAPTNAWRLRIRQHVSRGSAAVTATGTIYFAHIRRSRSVNKQVFTATGASTWTKPAGATWVRVELFGAGGGGGSGRRGAAGSDRTGGAGGRGGGYSFATFAASDLSDTVTVTVGAGGAGGANNTTNDTNGNNGTDGGSSTFGGYLSAQGGQGGQGGSTLVAGSTASGGAGTIAGGAGGVANAGAPGTAGGSGPTAGGGAGGAIDAANVSYNGGAGGVPGSLVGILSTPAGSTTAPVDGSAGATPSAGALGGSGGGGGADAGTPYRAGKAGGRGAGGGGGGASLNDHGTLAGGTGGDGYCSVTAW